MQQEQLVLPKGITIRSSTGDRYVIERLLGQGKAGAVYLVREQKTKKNLFALKEVVNPNDQDRQRLTFESEILTRLRHKALPRVYQVFENDKLKRVYILMDYIEGRNLDDLRQDEAQKRFDLPLVLTMMAPIVEALSYLHNQEPPIVHRDIKPANVILPVDADGTMLVDFGSAKEYISESNATVRSRYSPGYAAPEQYGSGTNTRTDIYGLAATIYTLLTGVVPTDATLRFIKAWGDRGDALKSADTLVPTIPESVAQALRVAMSIKSTERYANVEEFWQALTAHLNIADYQLQLPQITSTKPPLLLESPRERIPTLSIEEPEEVLADERKRFRFLLLILIVLVLAILVVLGIHFFQ